MYVGELGRTEKLYMTAVERSIHLQCQFFSDKGAETCVHPRHCQYIPNTTISPKTIHPWRDCMDKKQDFVNITHRVLAVKSVFLPLELT